MMKRWVCLLALVLAACTGVRPPTPKPPAPTTFRLQLYVHDQDGQPLVDAFGYRDNVAAENPNAGGQPFGLGPDAGWAKELPPQDFNVCGLRAGYTTECAPVPLHADLVVTVLLKKLPPPPPPPPPVVPTWTKNQLMDLQGDLMIWAPEIGCQSEETKIRCDAGGLQNGWVWSLTIPRYSAAHRAQLYGFIKARGWTHVAIDVNACEIGDGYHNLLPVTDCTGFDDQLNTVLREIRDQHLIAVCAGVAPDAPFAPGLDRSLCPIAMDDWDNDHKKDCRVKALAETFPNALLYVEMPQGKNPDGLWQPGPDACSPVPFPSGGGEWIRNLQRQYPNFVGVLYELTAPDGVDVMLSDLKNWTPWFRDLQEVIFETDTYWKFWSNLNVDAETQVNDQLRAAAPWTKGYFSGGTSHPVVPDQNTSGHYDGELDASTVQMVNAPDFRSWPQTTTLDQVVLGLDDMHLTFSAQASWPNVSFGIQYSIGLCVKLSQGWTCNAPIELWQGKPGGGGQIQQQDVDGSGLGQVAKNWWYADRWGALNGYQPKPGEQIGVFVVAGDARNNVSPVQERSNIVLVKMPDSGVAATFVK